MNWSQENHEPDYATQPEPAPKPTDEAIPPTRWSPDAWFDWRSSWRARRGH